MTFWRPFCIFLPLFLPEVDNVENWVTILNLVMRNTTYIPNYKKIGSKLWPWQCSRFFDKYGGRDVNTHVNELKLEHTQLDIWETLCGKFHWNRLSSFGVLAPTDRHTGRQTTRYFPTQTITIHSVNEMTECKNRVGLMYKDWQNKSTEII